MKKGPRAPVCHPRLDRGSRVFAFSIPLTLPSPSGGEGCIRLFSYQCWGTKPDGRLRQAFEATRWSLTHIGGNAKVKIEERSPEPLSSPQAERDRLVRGGRPGPPGCQG